MKQRFAGALSGFSNNQAFVSPGAKISPALLSGFSFFGPLYLVGEQFPHLITLAARKEDLNR